jgi:phosphomevalonate kinase
MEGEKKRIAKLITIGNVSSGFTISAVIFGSIPRPEASDSTLSSVLTIAKTLAPARCAC